MTNKRWKIFVVAIVLVVVALTLSACDGDYYKTGNRITGGKDVQTFTYAYVVLDGQEIARGAITQWRDYENSDVVQVLVNGKYYLTHYSNVVLIADPEQGALNYGDVSWHGVDE
ncbi:MAG: hypothetical protein LIR46_00285 [Bacteroidota bacterium]|nr:hypothetical protein [Bacteroidota bacterium]